MAKKAKTAWVFQDARQKQKLGASKCPWSVGWYHPETRRRTSKTFGPHWRADKARREIAEALNAGASEDGLKAILDGALEHDDEILYERIVLQAGPVELHMPAHLSSDDLADLDDWLRGLRRRLRRRAGGR